MDGTPLLGNNRFQPKVGSWHFPEVTGRADDVRSWGVMRTLRPRASTSENDHSGNGSSLSVQGLVGDAGFPLVDDRGVNGVLEQIRIHNSNVPVQPGRYAEVDTDQ